MCGSVQYQVTAGSPVMYYCHCGTCRAASGSGFATNIAVATQSFAVTAGKELLSSFESSPGKRRYFCSRCASPIYSHSERTRDYVSVRCGTLKDDPGVRPSFHAYVASKAPWISITDGLPQYPEGRS